MVGLYLTPNFMPIYVPGLLSLLNPFTIQQENLLRELSAAGESGYRPQPKKGEGPSTVSKRKHQITYLAFQAKEREQLLKNQWAANAQTKRQTQAKYGF